MHISGIGSTCYDAQCVVTAQLESFIIFYISITMSVDHTFPLFPTLASMAQLLNGLPGSTLHGSPEPETFPDDETVWIKLHAYVKQRPRVILLPLPGCHPNGRCRQSCEGDGLQPKIRSGVGDCTETGLDQTPTCTPRSDTS